MKKILILTAFALFVAIAPVKAHAFSLGQLVDPLCLFACDNDKPSTRVITNSYNQGSYNNTTVTSNSNPVAYCSNCGTPTYPNYPNYPQQTSPLGISCYSSPTSARVGDSISWGSSPYGGNGNYYVTWSGNDSLSGYGTSISKTYYNPGSKYASVTVTSGNQTATANCGNNVQIYDSYNNNYPNYPNYPQYPNYPTYSQLYISCIANTSYTTVGSSVSWTATVNGGTGNGYYNFNWSGTDGLNGYGQTAYVQYNYPGTKTASVTVTTGNQTTTQYCSNSVNVTGQQIINNNNNSLQIACYADKTSARIDTPVTWAVEAVGGTGNYSYSWTGTDGLSSSQSSVIKSYQSTGAKTATVTVTASNGQTSTQTCGNAVSITRPVVGGGTTVIKTPPKVDNNTDMSAAALFSLKNVPWGWVAILILLIMFSIIIYLIYNRNKV